MQYTKFPFLIATMLWMAGLLCLNTSGWAEEVYLTNHEEPPAPMTTVSELMEKSAPPQETKDAAKAETPPPATAEIPAVDTKPTGMTQKVKGHIKGGVRDAKALSEVRDWHDLKNFKKVSYTPLAAVAIFPVIYHGTDKAFGDLAVLFSNEFANTLEQKAQGTKVLNPVYTVEELKIRGLDRVYQKVMDYYVKAGRPEPKALNYLLKELSADGRQIQRVAFVSAEADMNNYAKNYGISDRMKGWMTDSLPSEERYDIKSRIQIFDSANPELPLVWGFTWSRTMKANRVNNVTSSVYQDSDSVRSFSQASRWMSREILTVIPKHVYLEEHPIVDESVDGANTTVEGARVR